MKKATRRRTSFSVSHSTLFLFVDELRIAFSSALLSLRMNGGVAVIFIGKINCRAVCSVGAVSEREWDSKSLCVEYVDGKQWQAGAHAEWARCCMLCVYALRSPYEELFNRVFAFIFGNILC